MNTFIKEVLKRSAVGGLELKLIEENQFSKLANSMMCITKLRASRISFNFHE